MERRHRLELRATAGRPASAAGPTGARYAAPGVIAPGRGRITGLSTAGISRQAPR
ncbi:hypothetical protein [Streptomyces sp. NBC_01794]|uniref:hypothetical protein n=1 Tax=Streptomyces sp. NBC_01794 TaxID=2975942 RepID=UPI00308E3003|nr:hypothetical protein OIE54_29125 [Streptomyces sp. NBC_01794]